MDPDACLTQLLDAFRDGNKEAAWDAIEALGDWLAMGGAMPLDPRRDVADLRCRYCGAAYLC